MTDEIVLAHTDPCVCVQSDERDSGYTNSALRKSQDGGVCMISHTLFRSLERSSSSIVASQSASSSSVQSTLSTSRVLAQC